MCVPLSKLSSLREETVSLSSSFCKSLCERVIVEKIQWENRSTKIFIYDLYRQTFLVRKPNSPPFGCYWMQCCVALVHCLNTSSFLHICVFGGICAKYVVFYGLIRKFHVLMCACASVLKAQIGVVDVGWGPQWAFGRRLRSFTTRWCFYSFLLHWSISTQGGFPAPCPGLNGLSFV